MLSTLPETKNVVELDVMWLKLFSSHIRFVATILSDSQSNTSSEIECNIYN